MNSSQDANLQLDRHLDAIRGEPVPPGPPPSLVEDTLAKIRDAERSFGSERGTPMNRRRTLVERLVEMTFARKLAAAVFITVGGITLYFVFLLFSSMGASVVLADVLEKVKSARTLTYRTTATVPGHPPIEFKTLLSEPDRMRTEMPGGMVSIAIGRSCMILDSNSHTAIRIDMANPISSATQPAAAAGGNLVAMFRAIPAGGENVGEKKIDGVAAQGFRVSLGQMTMTIWADKKTSRPIQIDSTTTTSLGDVASTMDHFEIDPALDDSLFSLDTPKGYTAKTQTIEIPDAGGNTAKLEDAVSDVLRGYSDATGGDLPPSLTDWADLMRVAVKEPKGRLGPSRVGSLSGALFSLPNGYGYAGKGVKLGEKDKIVFWYRPDAALPGYRVIYGDLRVADVTADKLPTTKPSQP